MPSTTNPVLNNYPNPLDNFRTYSYQFILTLSNTSQAIIDQLGGGTNSTSTNNSNQPSPLLSAALAATKPGDKMTIGQSDVYLILDTRRFSQYSITGLNMTHQYGTGDIVNPTTAVVAHTMQVIDTTGISFFNMLMDLFQNKIKSSRFSAFFLLAIQFVGHKDDGTTETISTTYIPMTLMTLGLVFGASGGTFDLAFNEIEGGFSRDDAASDQINYLGDTKSLTTDGLPNNIGGLIQALETGLNVASLEAYQKYASAITTGQGATDNPAVPGKLVQYMITIPKNWYAYPLDTSEQSSNQEQMYKATTQDTGVTKVAATQPQQLTTLTPGASFSSIKFSDATTIPDAIKSILESSTSVLKMLSTDQLNAGTATSFKIVTVITSDATTFTVHYDIYPHAQPNVPDAKQQSGDNTATTSQVQSGSTSADSTNQYQNVITYNYLYSGKNNSIIALEVRFDPSFATQVLDTNLNMGTARFGELAGYGQVQKVVSQNSGGTAVADQVFTPDIRAQDPVFIPVKSKDQKSNNATQKNSEAVSVDAAKKQLNLKQQYTQSIATVSFLSNMQLDMTIRGNPKIIEKYAGRGTRGCPPHGPPLSAQQINTLTHSGQGTASTNYANVVSPTLQTAKDAYYQNYFYPRIAQLTNSPSTSSNTDALLSGPDVAVHPLYVLVKIYAPNLDETGNYKAGAPMYTDEFFYNGVYQVMLIESHFQGGEFTQELTLRADQTTPSGAT